MSTFSEWTKWTLARMEDYFNYLSSSNNAADKNFLLKDLLGKNRNDFEMLCICSIFIITSMMVIISTFVVCSKKKPQAQVPPPASLKKSTNSNRASAIFSAPVSNAVPQSQPSTRGGEAPATPVADAAAATAPAQAEGTPTGSKDKLQASDPSKPAKEQQSNTNLDNKQTAENNEKKTTEKKPDEKKENEKQDEEKKGTKDATKEGGGGGTGAPTKDGTKEEPKATTTPAATAKQQAAPPQEKQQPRGMELHKSMKVKNKKKTHEDGETNKAKVADSNTKGTLKQDGDTDDEDNDDETLKGVTSLKVDPKVPFSVDEPAP